jgi:UDP-GlcNAc:undecaprenyl-phosphate/decaprenyl-phosphate GlcNAc-1-phosphate transferase
MTLADETAPALFAFIIALMTSFALTPVARRLAVPLDFIDRPGPRKVHLTPTPLLGGLAIYVGAVLATVLFNGGLARGQIVGILGGSTLLLVVGMLDDKKILHPQLKLMGAAPMAAFVLLASGVHASVFSSSPWLGEFADLKLITDYAVTVVWVVGITAAFNILDHMDGLCAGIAAVASAFFLYFAGLGGQLLVAPLAAAVLGASLGFLRWNFKPAKIFMGDGGALFLGFLLATLGVKLRVPSLPAETTWMVPILILGVPIFDTALVTISRTRRGLLPFASPGKDHTAHRLAALGFGQRGAVLLLYAGGIVFGLLALVVSRLSVWQGYALASLIVLMALLAIVLLERVPYERQERINA